MDCDFILPLYRYLFLLLFAVALLKQDDEKAMPVVMVSDSGIEDPSSYQEPVQIHVGDSEFNTTGNWSTLEGSIADTDYAERMTQRQSSSGDKNNTRSTRLSSFTSEESQNESLQKPSRKNRNQPTLNDPVSSEQRKHEVQSLPQGTDNVSSPNQDSVPSQRPPGTKRKSSKNRPQDSGIAEVSNSEKVPGYTDSHQRAAEDAKGPKSPNNGIQTDEEITRRHSKPRASSGARISGKTTGV